MTPFEPPVPEHVIAVGGVDLCVATFGSRGHPAVFLPSVATLHWDDDFCRELAGAGRFVVRYDLRDTGRSTTYPAGAPGYDFADLVGDLIGLLDTFELPRAHLVGFSVAGWVCQLAALDHPDRVSALSLINTRPTAPGPADPDLPEHAARVLAFFGDAGEPDWTDRTAVVDHCVRYAHVLAGTSGGAEPETRRRVARTVTRTTDMASSTANLAFVDSGARWRERLGDITVPTLVVHGTDDPFFPYGNGEALAREIPHAELLPLPGVGHELPASTWPRVLAALLAVPAD